MTDDRRQTSDDKAIFIDIKKNDADFPHRFYR